MVGFQLYISFVISIVIISAKNVIRAPGTSSSFISFERYNRYGSMMKYLDYLNETYPKLVSVTLHGKTYENRDIKTISISDRKGKKPIILIDAGIHAREWIAPAVALYLIQELVENSEENKSMLTGVDWLVLPLVNPDGYEYSHSSVRMWRKTRSRNRGTSCVGTDLNRNFDIEWLKTGSSKSPCSEVYAGSEPLSEPEAKILDKILSSSDLIKLYITFHSYGGYILYPWSYKDSSPANEKDLKSAGQSAANAIRKFSGTRYQVGRTASLLSMASGGTDDYAKAVSKIDLSYTWELPENNFVLPKTRIKQVVGETFQGLKAFAKYVRENYGEL